MQRRLVRVSILLVFTVLTGAALAAEGRIPVWAPGTVLAADGKYIVTRNIAGGGGAVIVIGAPNVDLDLNGFTITGAAGSPVISVAGGSDHTSIRNGVLMGGAVGIDVPGPTRKVDIEGVKIHDPAGAGIHLGDVEGAALRWNEITDTAAEGISWDGPAFTKHGSIESNLLRKTSAAIVVTTNCSSVAITNNRIEEPGTGAGGAFPGTGIALASCGGSLLSENTIEKSKSDGINLIASKGNKLLDNVIRTAGGNGIHLDPGSSDNFLLHNVATGSGTGALPSGGSGIMIESPENVAETNVTNANSGIGIHYCGPAACSNTFGRNTARGNTGAVFPAFCGACAVFGAGASGPNSCNTAAACGTPNTSSSGNLIPGPPIF
ncbi:MAG TPA: right-handed parallel beta-helix repeat-containing protein [Candidatus Polarisedimenticolaceae bacterium]|nr:right-handed parallel beta-helix repeat-containing protein [Candidatus Polarisedimenticolaceae bacterium]